jgi:hypothetical protein
MNLLRTKPEQDVSHSFRWAEKNHAPTWRPPVHSFLVAEGSRTHARSLTFPSEPLSQSCPLVGDDWMRAFS